MDVDRLRQLFTEAFLLPVPLDSGTVILGNASSAQRAAILTNKGRSPQVSLAKKVLRLEGLVQEIEKELQALGGSKPDVRGKVTKKRPDGVGLEIVPFVRSVPPEAAPATEPLDERASTAAVETTENPALTMMQKTYHFFAPHLWIAARVVKVAMHAPIILIYIGMLYGLIGFFYVLAHPELWIKAGFAALDLLPNYAEYMMTAMANQVKEELSIRFR